MDSLPPQTIFGVTVLNLVFVTTLSLLSLSHGAFSQALETEVVLPLSKRKIDFSFARELSKSDLKTAIVKLKLKGVRVLRWNGTKGLLENDETQMPTEERVPLETFLREATTKFKATTFAKGHQTKHFTAAHDYVVLNALDGGIDSAALAHEWLHIALSKTPPTLMGDKKTPSYIELSNTLSALKKQVADEGLKINLTDPTSDYVFKNAARYETLIKFQYVYLLGQLVTLYDEWDIHAQMGLSGVSKNKVDELALVAQHLEKRLNLASEWNSGYRVLLAHRESLTKDTVTYGNGALTIEQLLKGLVDTYFEQVKTVLSDVEIAELGEHKAARRLFNLK